MKSFTALLFWMDYRRYYSRMKSGRAFLFSFRFSRCIPGQIFLFETFFAKSPASLRCFGLFRSVSVLQGAWSWTSLHCCFLVFSSLFALLLPCVLIHTLLWVFVAGDLQGWAVWLSLERKSAHANCTPESWWTVSQHPRQPPMAWSLRPGGPFQNGAWCRRLNHHCGFVCTQSPCGIPKVKKQPFQLSWSLVVSCSPASAAKLWGLCSTGGGTPRQPPKKNRGIAWPAGGDCWWSVPGKIPSKQEKKKENLYQ